MSATTAFDSSFDSSLKFKEKSSRFIAVLRLTIIVRSMSITVVPRVHAQAPCTARRASNAKFPLALCCDYADSSSLHMSVQRAAEPGFAARRLFV